MHGVRPGATRQNNGPPFLVVGSLFVIIVPDTICAISCVQMRKVLFLLFVECLSDHSRV